MAIGYTMDSETMEDVYQVKEELSIRNSLLTPEERWREEREAMERFTTETGYQFTFADPH
jgi:hypothetical protein